MWNSLVNDELDGPSVPLNFCFQKHHDFEGFTVAGFSKGTSQQQATMVTGEGMWGDSTLWEGRHGYAKAADGSWLPYIMEDGKWKPFQPDGLITFDENKWETLQPSDVE
eukprot:g56664.t1